VRHITETLRLRPEAVRSDHATHSVAAVGARAAELVAHHGASGPRLGPFGLAAFALESPWEKFYQWNAAYCFIGVTFYVNTMVHYVESRIIERALARASAGTRARLDGRVRAWIRPGVWPGMRSDDREQIESRLSEQEIVRYGQIGSAVLPCARARPMVDEWLVLVEHEPAKRFPDDFPEWLRHVR
jgi:aminoglycoside 3-N-acetyltransferase